MNYVLLIRTFDRWTFHRFTTRQAAMHAEAFINQTDSDARTVIIDD